MQERTGPNNQETVEELSAVRDSLGIVLDDDTMNAKDRTDLFDALAKIIAVLLRWGVGK